MPSPPYPTLAAVIGASFAYAIVRYHLFGDVPWAHLPTFITNKAISVVAVASLLLSAIASLRSTREYSAWWGNVSLHAAFLHILLSLAVLDASYFPAFFESGSGRFSLRGELVIAFGTAAAYLYWILYRRREGSRRPTMRFLTTAAAIAITAHIAAVGLPGWFTPGKWHGGMPPISLLTALGAFAAGGLYLLRGMVSQNK